MSKIPSLEEMLKLYTKKDLWNRIQEKIQQIAELQKQLEEKEKEIEDLKRKVNYAVEDLRNTGMRFELETFRANKLEDELKSQPAEIVEKIKKWGQKHYNWVGDGTGYDGQDYNECIGFNTAINQLNEVLDTLLKEYQK